MTNPKGIFRIGGDTFTVARARLWSSSYARPDLTSGVALAIEIECNPKRAAWGSHCTPVFNAWLPMDTFEGVPPHLVAKQGNEPWDGAPSAASQRTAEASIVVDNALPVTAVGVRIHAASRLIDIRGTCEDDFTGAKDAEAAFIIVADDVEIPGAGATPAPLATAETRERAQRAVAHMVDADLLMLAGSADAANSLADSLADILPPDFDAIAFVFALERHLDHPAVDELLGETEDLEQTVARVLAD